MPISEAKRQYHREYQRQWLLRRRADWIQKNGPCQLCGSWELLEVDHIDASTKQIPVTRLWSLSPGNPKRITELAKCRVLCEECHKAKTLKHKEYAHGEQSGRARLTEIGVHTARELFSTGNSILAISELLNVHRRTIYDVVHRKTWQHL